MNVSLVRPALAALALALTFPLAAAADPPIVPLAVFTTIEVSADVTLACPKSTTTLHVALGAVAKFYGTGACRLSGTAYTGGRSFAMKAIDVTPSATNSTSRTIEKNAAGEYYFR